jgi:hypothetical protein
MGSYGVINKKGYTVREEDQPLSVYLFLQGKQFYRKIHNPPEKSEYKDNNEEE